MTRVGGRYEILGELGRGGMATVHLARQTDLDRLVALKELSGVASADPAASARFLREARFAGSLSHPNVVTIHDFFEQDGTPFIAMEHVPGGMLRRYQGRLSPAQLFGVLLDVLAGLAHAERLGIVHRDLKPENLLVTADGRVKIADFGIARAIDRMRQATRLTATGTTIGTPDYIAPEQAMGDEVGPWSDLYSLGCIAFELLTGGPPFADADSSMAILLSHVNDRVPAVRSVDPAVDPQLAAWVARVTAREPEERTRSAAAAAAELEDIALETLGPRWRATSAVVPELDDIARVTRPRTRIAPVAAATVAAAPAGAALAATMPPTRRPTGPTAALPPERHGHRARRTGRALLWTAALALAAVTAFAQVTGSGGRQATSASPTPAATTTAVKSDPRPASTTLGVTTTQPGRRARRSVPRENEPVAAADPVVEARTTPTPMPTQTPTATPAAVEPLGCAGDSVSDDPSDDGCDGGGEP